MTSINTNSVTASLLALAFSFIAAPAAMAEETIYPGSNCGFERQGTNGTLDKQNASINTSARTGMVVTCPIPINVPLKFQLTFAARSVDFNINVHIKDPRQGRPVNCMVRVATLDGSGVSTNDTPVQTSSGRGFNSILLFQNVTFQLPLREWAVLRCQMNPGSTIAGYSVSTLDF